REKIWRRCLPEGSHAIGPEAFHLLGRRLELAGGSIRQITLRAAFAAAATDSKITLSHIDAASRAEFLKLGLPAVDLRIREAAWVGGDAIVQVPRALKARLQPALGHSGVPGWVYVGPLDAPEAKKHPLVLSLSRMTPSPSLRNLDHRVPGVNPP